MRKTAKNSARRLQVAILTGLLLLCAACVSGKLRYDPARPVLVSGERVHVIPAGSVLTVKHPDGTVREIVCKTVGKDAYASKVWYLMDDVSLLLMYGIDPQGDGGK